MVDIYDKSLNTKNQKCEEKYDSVALPYLEWDEEGNILCASNALIEKCGLHLAQSFTENFKNVNVFFTEPTTKESIDKAFSAKLAKSEKRFLEKYPVFIRAESSTIHTYADIEIDKNGKYIANIEIDKNGKYIANIEINSWNIFQEIVEKRHIPKCRRSRQPYTEFCL